MPIIKARMIVIAAISFTFRQKKTLFIVVAFFLKSLAFNFSESLLSCKLYIYIIWRLRTLISPSAHVSCSALSEKDYLHFFKSWRDRQCSDPHIISTILLMRTLVLMNSLTLNLVLSKPEEKQSGELTVSINA